jgi:hypothetical protein
MPSVICVHFSQHIDHYVTYRHEPRNIIEHTHAKLLVSALERQVSWGDTNDEVVDHFCNPTYASKWGKWHYITHVTLNTKEEHKNKNNTRSQVLAWLWAC